jgi:hypothetical protein
MPEINTTDEAARTATATNPSSTPTGGKISVVDLSRFKDTVIFVVSLHRWGNSKKIKDAAAVERFLEALKLDTTPDAEAKPLPVFVASDRMKNSKVLLQSPRLDRLNKAMTALKTRVESMSMPSYFRPGMFVTKLSNAVVVSNALKDGWKAIEANELRDFLAGYAEDVAAARTAPVKKGGLGPLFNEGDYPNADEVRKAFSVDFFPIALSVPENIPDELKQEARDEFKRRMDDAASQIEQALRAEFLELVTHAEERLTPTPGEKPKVFRDSAIGNLMTFIQTFDSRDVFGDDRLKLVVEQAKGLLLDERGKVKLDAQKLRDYPSVREAAREKFTNIRKALDGLLEEQGRGLDLSE